MSDGRMTLTSERMARLIAVALEEDGLTQAEFCRRVGVSAKHVNTVLAGKQTARPGMLDYWAFALGRRWVISLEPVSGDQEGTSG